MLKVIFVLLLIFAVTVNADLEYRVENTNLSVSQKSLLPSSNKTYLYNYDRLRLRTDYTQDNFFATAIVDAVNYYGSNYTTSPDFEFIRAIESDTPFSSQSDFHDYGKGSTYAKVYRLYGGYEDTQNRIIVGLQNISMGVGRVWTPTNIFNPKNIYALEPDEVFGVFGLSYTRYINDTSHVRVVSSQKADKSFKYAAIYKSYMSFADIGLSVIRSNQTQMLGYEIEANVLDSGVEFRSEGAYIKNESKEFFQGIVGLDYGFVNGISIVAELLYSSEDFSSEDILYNINSEINQNLVDSKLYTALSLSYSFNIFLDGSLLYIESFDGKDSKFISPTLTYTLNDYNSFTLGSMLQSGDKDRYFFKWSLSF